jgi:GDP-L-fucose synthase
MAKKILVTGGCGFVGRHLVKKLSQDPENIITIIDDLSTGLHPGAWPDYLRARVATFIQSDCIPYFETSMDRFDVVFHLAAVVEGRLTIEHNPLKVAKDLMIDAAMFRWAVRTNPGKIIYFSSSAAYPINLQTREHNVALAESMLDIRNGIIGIADMSYGWSKLTGEFLSYLAVEKHGMKVAVYRPFSGYGEDQAFTYPFPSIIKRVVENTNGIIDVWGTGAQSRDFIHIDDCVDIILATYEKIDDASALNLGSGVRTTFKELIVMAGVVLGKKTRINALIDKPEGVFARYCDSAKQIKFGLLPKISLEEGIKRTADFIQNNGILS